MYSQVPAFTATDRAMIDVLTCTLDGRLVILELKADEDIHLPLQGLDYWARVRWHQHRGDFPRNGYFAGRELSNAPPLLFLVAPALRIHPATDMLAALPLSANRVDPGAGGRALARRSAGGEPETPENILNRGFTRMTRIVLRS